MNIVEYLSEKYIVAYRTAEDPRFLWCVGQSSPREAMSCCQIHLPQNQVQQRALEPTWSMQNAKLSNVYLGLDK